MIWEEQSEKALEWIAVRATMAVHAVKMQRTMHMD
jgi:hypothetical protein